RVEPALDRVLHVRGGDLFPVVEADAGPEREVDRPGVDDLPARSERRALVELGVPLDEGLVHRLLAPMVRGEDRPERRDGDGVLLERERDLAALLRRGADTLRRGGRLARDRA